MPLNSDADSSSKSKSLFVDGNRMYISLRRYHLLHLLANNTVTVAVITTAGTSARLDKARITNRWLAIPERSAVNPCLPSPGPQEAQDQAGMGHLNANWANRTEALLPRLNGKAPYVVLLTLALLASPVPDGLLKFQRHLKKGSAFFPALSSLGDDLETPVSKCKRK